MDIQQSMGTGDDFSLPNNIYGVLAQEPKGTKPSSLLFPVRRACWLAAIDWPRELDGRVAFTLADTGVGVTLLEQMLGHACLGGCAKLSIDSAAHLSI